MQLTIKGDRYIARSSYEERAIPKQARFRWDPANKVWWTNEKEKAAKLINFADESAKRALGCFVEEKTVAVVESRATDSDVDLPVPSGLSYLPYQRAGIAFASSRNSTLIGDPMGLGKTIQAIGVINVTRPARTLIVCPASLRLNWARETEKWLTHDATIQVIEGGKPVELTGDIVVINYDIVKKHLVNLTALRWDLLIADEAHFMKNPKAARTKATLSIKAARKIFMTGTPIPNRPIEVFPLLDALVPGEFGSFFTFAKRYANAHQNGFGWDFSGSSNLGELQERMRSTVLIRRDKEEVLTDLPAKVRQVVTVPQNGAAAAVKAEQRAAAASEHLLQELASNAELAKAESEEAYKAAVTELSNAQRVAFQNLSQVRKDVAIAKAKYVVDHVVEATADGRQVVLFAHHREVVTKLREQLQDAGLTTVEITGSTPMAARQQAVDDFQAGRAKVFIGNIIAAGVGLTLTASAHVVFAELDWVPGNVTQAEDRCHRIGQTNSVLVQHIVIDGSLDAKLAQTLVNKQAVIDKALDDEIEIEPIVIEEPTTKRVKRSQLVEEGEALTQAQILKIHEGLRIVASMDQDRARELNGVGFSAFDGRIGHSLAEAASLSPAQAAIGRRLVRKYRRQLGDEFQLVAGEPPLGGGC
tara:strand:- start:10 stop:1944 length:1935 start_codon:yes stop_codon:yes gene_type:complete